jgi:hypothetical protein
VSSKSKITTDTGTGTTRFISIRSSSVFFKTSALRARKNGGVESVTFSDASGVVVELMGVLGVLEAIAVGARTLAPGNDIRDNGEKVDDDDDDDDDDGVESDNEDVLSTMAEIQLGVDCCCCCCWCLFGVALRVESLLLLPFTFDDDDDDENSAADM